MPKKKEITIEDLAGMVKRGFDETDGRLDNIDGRLDNIDGRLDNIDGRLDNIDGRLGSLESRFETVEKFILSQHKHRIERLEVEVKNLKDLFALK